MVSLLRCEFKKFKSTYINALSFFGMLIPLALVALAFIVRRNEWIKSGNYNWDTFNQQLSMFFVFLVGPIITSFIAVFSVFYEYQVKTMKNILTSPHGRIKIIAAKIIYVSAFIILQYIIVALGNILCGLLLGFNVTTDKAVQYSWELVLAGFSTVIFVPFMMMITLIFRSFIPPMVLTVAGTISNVLALNWEKSFLSPWAIPADFALIATKHIPMELTYPLLSACAYFVLFMAVTLIYFRQADQTG